MASTQPTRVGFIGFSKAGWAARSHSQYLTKSDKYKIVAVANSSTESSQKAITDFELPETTKAYGTPEDIAKDPDVQLVIDSVRVDKHFPTIKPSIIAGKSVLVEWPLGKNLAEAEELLRLSKEHKVPSAHVVLQGNFSATVQTIRSLLSSGRIGKVLSSTYVGRFGMPVKAFPSSGSYLYDSKVGGNVVTIFAGHALGYIQHAFGETLDIHSSQLVNRWPDVAIINPDGTQTPTTKDTHDLVSFLARTSSTKVPFSLTLTPEAPFKGSPGLDWRIYGEKGEIRITAPSSNLTFGFPEAGAEVVEVHDFDKDTVEKVEPKQEKTWLDELVLTGRNMGRLYEALSAGDETSLVSFEQAVQIHRIIDELLKANPV